MSEAIAVSPARTVAVQAPGWSSRVMFVTAAAGSAVGLGNIWKFPYIVGEHGGGAFVLVYLACLVLMGLPILIAEITIGRSGGAWPARSFIEAGAQSGMSRQWGHAGRLGAMTALIVLSFYTVVAGWVLIYALDYLAAAVAGGFPVADPAARFDQVLVAPVPQFVALLAIVAIGYSVIARRAVRGIELAMTWLAPLFLLLLTILGLYAAVIHPAPLEVWDYLFRPDFSALSVEAVAQAVGHAFFTLSVGMCAMLVYGAYLGERESVPRLAVTVTIMDTAVAMACAFIVFGIAFASGADPAEGPGLIFVVLPHAFAGMAGGTMLGALFFLAVFVAAITSIVAVMIVVARAAEETFGVSTQRSALVCALAVLAGGCAVIASTTGLWDIRLLGMPLLDALDHLASSILMPLMGLAVAVFAGRALASELTSLSEGRLLLFCLRWIAPACLLFLAAVRIATAF